jgi:outer membrane protein
MMKRLAIYISPRCGRWLLVMLLLSMGLIADGIQYAIAQSQSQLTQESLPAAPAANLGRQGSKPIPLTLVEVVELLLKNNRDLKNASLDRIVQRQQLREAKSVFTPQVQPLLGIGVSQFLTKGRSPDRPIAASLSSVSVSGFGGSGRDRTDTLNSQTTLNYNTQLSGRVRTRLGTTLSVAIDPLQPQPVGLVISQPLLRGSGVAINTAPVKKAELTENRNQLELDQILIDKITQASLTYRAIARSQENLAIQQLSLANQRRQQEIIQILVNAGRRSRSELVDIDGNIAATQTQQLIAQNALEQAKADLLNLLDLETPVNITVPQSLIDDFKAGNLATEAIASLSLNDLLQTAYAKRPDYQQAQLASQIATLDLRIAQDNKRWGLDLVGTSSLGETSQAAAGIVLTRVFQDQSLETAFQQARIDRLKRENTVANLKDSIRLEVESRYRDVLSARDRIASTRKARELAAQRLEIAQIKFKRGRDGVDIFQVLELQNNLVRTQNEEVNAKIDFLDALSRLEQVTGMTLDTWRTQLNSALRQ